jgi:endonuclease/exonuclease/phosphatase family metal-dependent hydrolase
MVSKVARCAFTALAALAAVGCSSPPSPMSRAGLGAQPTGTAAITATVALGAASPAPAAAPTVAANRAVDLERGVAPDATPRLSTITFNMRHRDKPRELETMADSLVRDFPDLPDFILCQEVVFKKRRSGPSNTAERLADELGYHCRGTKRTSDREGLAIISRYPFAYYADRHLRSRTNGLLLGFRRVSVMGEFIVPGVGRVRVANVHLAHWGFESRVRKRQLQETLDWIALREEQVPADVIILGGDFNADPDTSTMSLVANPVTAGGLMYLDYNSDRPTKGRKGHPTRRIDYIFVAAADRDVRMVDERLLWTDGLSHPGSSSRFHLSDHVPVRHEYEIGAPVRATAVDWTDGRD